MQRVNIVGNKYVIKLQVNKILLLQLTSHFLLLIENAINLSISDKIQWSCTKYERKYECKVGDR